MSNDEPRAVDRIEKNKGRKLAFGLAVIAFLAGVGLRITDDPTFWGIVVGATVVGYLVGRTIKQRWCSGCNERLTYDDDVCPGCRGRIRGNVSG